MSDGTILGEILEWSKGDYAGVRPAKHLSHHAMHELAKRLRAERALLRAQARGLREAAEHADRQTPPGREEDERLGMPANIARAIRERAAALEKEAGDG